MSSITKLSEASRSLTTVCLVAILPAFFATAASGGWNQSCAALCNAAQAIQSYGTGPDDGACLAACNSGTTT